MFGPLRAQSSLIIGAFAAVDYCIGLLRRHAAKRSAEASGEDDGVDGVELVSHDNAVSGETIEVSPISVNFIVIEYP